MSSIEKSYKESFIHPPQVNGQEKSGNKVILFGIKKKHNDAKGMWSEQVHGLYFFHHWLHLI